MNTPAIKHDTSQTAIFTICKLGPGLAPELLFWGGAPAGVTVGVIVRTRVATCEEDEVVVEGVEVDDELVEEDDEVEVDVDVEVEEVLVLVMGVVDVELDVAIAAKVFGEAFGEAGDIPATI